MWTELQRWTQIPNYWDYLTLTPEAASTNATSPTKNPRVFVTGKEAEAPRAEAACKYVSDRQTLLINISMLVQQNVELRKHPGE